MSNKSRIVQDHRFSARADAHLECHFSFEGVTHEAYIRDISLKAAFLWSVFTPPTGGDVILTLDTHLLTKTLTLEGRVVRNDCGLTGRGTASAFVVYFNHSPVALLKLINKLS